MGEHVNDMEQVQYLMLEHYEQLKSLSDPLRCRIVSLLISKAYTGQQLSQELEIPRAKIHYHLTELEKNGLVAAEVGDYYWDSTVHALELARLRAILAPEHAFVMKKSDQLESPPISLQAQIHTSEEKMIRMADGIT